MAKANRFSSRLWSVVMTLICVLWMYPIFMALMISLKQPTAISTATAFELPNADTFAGFVNYENAINQQGFFSSLFYSVLITVTSVFAILIFCSMFAWYITRVHTRFTKLLYGLCAFSMVVPFQMVMFTLSSMADTLHLRTPWTLWIIYLGFGAGLAVFMFAGFMKTVPLEIEEAAMIAAATRSRPTSRSSSRCCDPRWSPSPYWRPCGYGTITSCPRWCWTCRSTRPYPCSYSSSRVATAAWSGAR